MGGSADIRKQGTQEFEALKLVTLESNPSYTENNPREKLKCDIANDESLETLRKLADTESNGYAWEHGLLIRHRLDELGLSKIQLCL